MANAYKHILILNLIQKTYNTLPLTYVIMKIKILHPLGVWHHELINQDSLIEKGTAKIITSTFISDAAKIWNVAPAALKNCKTIYSVKNKLIINLLLTTNLALLSTLGQNSSSMKNGRTWGTWLRKLERMKTDQTLGTWTRFLNTRPFLSGKRNP